MMRTISKDEAANAKRVLTINVTHIGDTILATPVSRAIARFFPNARVTSPGHPKRVEVVESLSFLEKKASFTKRRAPYRGWADKIRGPACDGAFGWGNDQALVRDALRKARHVVAEQQTDTALNEPLFCGVQLPPRNATHAAMWALGPSQAIGIPDDGYRLDYCVTPNETVWAKSRLSDSFAGDATTGPRIGMQVAGFATKRYRDWPIEHFIALIKRTLEGYPEARFFLYGTAEGKTRIAKIIEPFPHSAINFEGELTLRETVAIMNKADAYVGVDTSPTHLFSALQKPMVVMYHPSRPSAMLKPLQHTEHPLRLIISLRGAPTIRIFRLGKLAWTKYLLRCPKS